nr:eukaryotic translation initiation factor 4E-like protein [Moumouvirus Monve]
MRKGIEPIWEDPRNSNGGTFTVKMNHLKGYEVWSLFVMYILGETLNEYDMDNINGITVSYISDAYNFNATAKQNINSFTYIKIWDGKSNRTRDEFINILPVEILDKIKHESIMYSQNNKKKILMNKILLVN